MVLQSSYKIRPNLIASELPIVLLKKILDCETLSTLVMIVDIACRLVLVEHIK